MKWILFVVVAYSAMVCSSAIEPLVIQAFKQFESHGCIILISESNGPINDLSGDVKVPYIHSSLGMLKRKDPLFHQCGHIIMNLDAYEPDIQQEIASKLPANHEIIFLSGIPDHINHFPKLSRLPLSLYFVRLNDSSVTIKRRSDIFKENEIKTLSILNGANNLGKTKGHFKLQLNFYGNSFPAVAFLYKPYSMPNYEDPSMHSGYEFEIARAVTESLDLKLEVYPPSSGFMWGSLDTQTGNYTGLLGDLQHSVAEIGWAHLMIRNNRLRVMDFSEYYMVEPACFLVKRGRPYHGVLSLIFPLESEVWVMVAIVCVAIAGYNYIFWKFSHEGSIHSYAQLMLYVWSIVFMESHRYSQESMPISFRLPMIVMIFGIFIVSVFYSGSLVSFFSVEVYPKNPETFEELAKKATEKDWKIRICCPNIIDAMEESSMESFKLLSEPERRLPISQRQIKEAVVATYQYGDIFAYTKNTLEIQKRLYNELIPYDEIFVMKECFLPIQIALGLSFNNPFKLAVNFRLRQLKEAGIVDKFIHEGYDMAGSVTNYVDKYDKSYEEIIGKDQVKYRQLGLSKTQGIFELHLCLLGLAILVFLVELWKHPLRRTLKEKISYFIKMTVNYVKFLLTRVSLKWIQLMGTKIREQTMYKQDE